ncbi:MAG TPA: cytidylate kinase-like family protein [Pirellulales bacterium]|nr:cytidylate kinase-like family protein [Pirellulales bacterium]
MDRSASQLVEDAFHRWEAQREAAARRELSQHKPPGFTIAISREAGTPGSAVADEVGTLLGWQVYDQELLQQIAREMGLRTSLLESVDEREQTWLHETIQGALAALVAGNDSPWASGSAFVHHLVETVIALGVHGDCVIVGRGAGFILPEKTTLRVRLVAPARDRVAMLSDKLNISEREAARRVRTIDRQRNDFVRDHFQNDPTDPRNFDLVLNAARLSIDDLARLIVDALGRFRIAAEMVRSSGEKTSGSTR